MNWRGARFEFRWPRPTLLMGIVNVTPDSFSDGGRYLDPELAIEHALELERAGADLLDIGGESTRPGAEAVDPAEEQRRVLPVIRGLTRRMRAPVSIDTQKAVVAAAALDAGACIVNDVSAGNADPALWGVVAARQAGYVCMHMQGTPRDMQHDPHYADVVGEVRAFLEERLDRLAAVGVAREQVALDVGLGFGKTLEHNLALLAHVESFRRLERPLLLGASRKSFIGKLLGVGIEERLPGSLACATWAVQAGVQILRVHDVAATRQAVALTEALLARAG